MEWFNQNWLWKHLPDNAFRGRRVFLVGSGPSLKGFDWSLLKGELTIGCNRAFEYFEPTIMFSIDSRFWGGLTGGMLGSAARDKFAALKRPKVFVNTQPPPKDFQYPHEFITIPGYARGRIITTSLKDGIQCGFNTGFAALNVAVCLGAKEIYLLGYDMQGANDHTAWHHENYPPSWMQDAGVYARHMIPSFENAAPSLKALGVRIVNLNPNSALDCFPFGLMKEIKPIERPMVVSFFTPENGYGEEVKRLLASLDLFQLEHDVQSVPTRGLWQKNTLYKPEFMREMMRKHRNKAVLWLDADAKVTRYPAIFDGLASSGYDAAAHYLRAPHPNGPADDHGELISSCVWINNNTKGRELVDLWIKECQENPEGRFGDQQNLQNVVEKKWEGRFLELPAHYCTIFDQLWETCQEPVIEQFQASRRLGKGAHHA